MLRKTFRKLKTVTAALWIVIVCSCSLEQDVSTTSRIQWTWLASAAQNNVEEQVVYEELFGDGNPIRFHQSMCVYDGLAFCFSHGTECIVIDLRTGERLQAEKLPESSHHNNAQFLNIFYTDKEKFPLLLLSRGDYPPNQNEFYIVRIVEKDEVLEFNRIQTIKNTIPEAKHGGSWVFNEETNTLYLYTMTKGDYRVKEGNQACILSFSLQGLVGSKEITLGLENVINRWDLPYLIYQGGTYFNGYLFFNVQSLQSIGGYKTETDKNILAINAATGQVDAIMPLTESMETEGICVSDNHLYVSFKNGNAQQDPDNTVFKIMRYSLPDAIISK